MVEQATMYHGAGQRTVHVLLSREEVETIGPDIQNISMLNCYNKQVEDELLKGSGWERDGYYPFDIASLAGSCVGG